MTDAFRKVKPGAVVRACLSGLTVARVYVPDPDKGYSTPKACDIEEGYTYDLTGGSTGGESILWIEDGPGEKWTLICIGHGDTSALFPVTLEKTGGAALAEIRTMTISIAGRRSVK